MKPGQDIPPEKIKHMLSGQKYDRILYIRDLDVSYITLHDCPAKINKKIYVFNHNTPGSRILCEDWGEEVLIHHNHYMTSFLDNLALVAIAYENYDYSDLSGLFASLSRKFIAEQMFELSESRMSRILFLENMITYNHKLRPIFKLRETNSAVKKTSDFFTSIASDFLLHHELGHLFYKHSGFQQFIDEAMRLVADLQEYADLPCEDTKSVFIEELSADIFSLAIVVKIYAQNVSKEKLKSYVRFFIISLVRMDTLYMTASELHKLNVDSAYKIENQQILLTYWKLRENILSELFNKVIDEHYNNADSPRQQDELLPLGGYEYLNALVDTDFSAPIFDETRLLAETISLGFDEAAGFKAIIDATRVTRMVERQI